MFTVACNSGSKSDSLQKVKNKTKWLPVRHTELQVKLDQEKHSFM